jgi:hypothetical protein
VERVSRGPNDRDSFQDLQVNSDGQVDELGGFAEFNGYLRDCRDEDDG